MEHELVEILLELYATTTQAHTCMGKMTREEEKGRDGHEGWPRSAQLAGWSERGAAHCQDIRQQPEQFFDLFKAEWSHPQGLMVRGKPQQLSGVPVWWVMILQLVVI
jgi:hypothetical protein